jgi:hypothetical protein
MSDPKGLQSVSFIPETLNSLIVSYVLYETTSCIFNWVQMHMEWWPILPEEESVICAILSAEDFDMRGRWMKESEDYVFRPLSRIGTCVDLRQWQDTVIKKSFLPAIKSGKVPAAEGQISVFDWGFLLCELLVLGNLSVLWVGSHFLEGALAFFEADLPSRGWNFCATYHDEDNPSGRHSESSNLQYYFFLSVR